MKRFATILILLLLVPAIAAQSRAQYYESEKSSWNLTGGVSWVDNTEENCFGTGWYATLETPAVATNWTIAMTMIGNDSTQGQIGARHWWSSGRTWLFVGGGVGVIEQESTDVFRPMAFGEGGFVWEFTDHLGMEVVGQVSGWEEQTAFVTGLRDGIRGNAAVDTETSGVAQFGARTGLTISF